MQAIRSIYPGEEVTTSYILPHHSYAERVDRTTRQWGFRCTCNLCSAPPQIISASDDRLLLIQHLEKQMANITVDRAVGPSTAEFLVSLYTQERLDGAIAEAYSYAALEYAYAADRHMAQKYAALAVEALVILRGPRYFATHSFNEMLAYPERHAAWNLTAILRDRDAKRPEEQIKEVVGGVEEAVPGEDHTAGKTDGEKKKDEKLWYWS
ncbi:hypothetical protein LTS18_001427 [Coniosporium uncinatum]|uniref:Uncharacterized protein n=1 Tax=Coniosporium uncinatum TaxID=93489 RepID=A0ACC3DF20_9PEZI|nr:hypothetical protein LTS18_001427 [Coniosporium uncinatum]